MMTVWPAGLWGSVAVLTAGRPSPEVREGAVCPPAQGCDVADGSHGCFLGGTWVSVP